PFSILIFLPFPVIPRSIPTLPTPKLRSIPSSAMADSDQAPPRCSTSTDETRTTSRTTSCSTQTTNTTATTTTTTTTTTEPGSPSTKLLLAAKPKPPPPPGTYVIQIPKDTIYRVPPPENAKRFDQLSKKNHQFRRRRCCSGGGGGGGGRRIFCILASFSASLLLLLTISAVVFFFVVSPKPPHYRIESVTIKGLDSPSSNSEISPEFEFKIRAHNRNKKMEMLYRPGSSAAVYYNGIELGTGSIPVFEQGKNQVTTFTAALKGNGILLTGAVQRSLKGATSFKVNVRAPVKFRLGGVKSWTFTAKVDCDVTVDKLTANATVVSQQCSYDVDVW
ncbi:NDR1/HIN1-like protein 13, partial [Linum grandiflorum]